MTLAQCIKMQEDAICNKDVEVIDLRMINIWGQRQAPCDSKPLMGEPHSETTVVFLPAWLNY
nr:MAG TPA: hypothetical protein [Caudoviricetes sp.]